MKKNNTVTGTQDWIGLDLEKRNKVSAAFSKLIKSFNLEEVELPVLEKLETFQKNLGESSDIVKKEMFSFDDMVLRPEGTAGVVRAVCSGWEEKLPLKVAYEGPMFRRETPQKGRYRQFDQLGVELLGFPENMGDEQCLLMAWQFLVLCELESKIKLKINYLGTEEEREQYKKALLSFLEEKRDQLSVDSQKRLETNVLRILDSKDKNDLALLEKAPVFSSFLKEESVNSLERVKRALVSMNIPFEVDERLVRGLDYYTGLVFEFVTTELGSQGTVLAGGRYDNLVKTMGGPDTPSIGWAAGKERLALLLPDQPEKKKPIIGFISLDDSCSGDILNLAKDLLNKTSYWGIEIPLNGSLNKKMKKLNKVGAEFVVICGSDEKSKGVMTIRNMTEGTQVNMKPQDLLLLLIVKSLG